MTELRKNFYEEVIDQMMIEEVAGLDNDIKETLEMLTTQQKRLAILSILDNNRDLFLRIRKLITDTKVGKTEYITQVVTMLREYVKVGEVEKKTLGEVMTPISLVEEMLNKLPVDVWSNPNLKWLDSCNGVGIFPSVVVKRLMDGLVDFEANEELRYKHIVENMLYVGELQPKNMFLFLCSFDPKDEYDMNIYNGSFLDEAFDNHMKEVWEVEKFDIIVGNPPYNSATQVTGASMDLYDKFILKSLELSHNILMVTPSRWFNKSDKSLLRKKLISEQRLEVLTQTEAFDDLNIRGGVSYFLSNKDNQTVLFNGKKEDLKFQVDTFDSVFLDQTDNHVKLSLIKKIFSKCKKVDNFNGSGYFGLKTNHSNISDEGFKCYFSGRRKSILSLSVDDTNGRHYTYIQKNVFRDGKGKLNKWKLFLPYGYGFKTKSREVYNQLGKSFIGKPTEICTQTYVFFDFDTELEAYNFGKFLGTQLVKYLVSLRKIKQDTTAAVFELVPSLDFNTEWNDDTLNILFGFDSDEISLINSLNFNNVDAALIQN
jgi:site-specific DNA-methyltransferase (adenine-specific)